MRQACLEACRISSRPRNRGCRAASILCISAAMLTSIVAPAAKPCWQFGSAVGAMRRTLSSRPSMARSVCSSRHEFEVWSFNLRTEFQDKQDGADGWSKRREEVADFIKRRRPALVCAQEATEAMLSYLSNQIGSAEYAWKATSRKPGQHDEAAGFLFDQRRLELVNYSASWLAEPGTVNGEVGWDAMYPRTYESALFRILDASGATETPLVRFVNTHFDHHGVEARKQSAKMLVSTVSAFEAEHPSCAQVICGDFNSPKSTEVYKILTGRDLGGQPPLRDAVRAAAAQDDLQGSGMMMSTIHKFQGVDFSEAKGDGTVDLDSEDSSIDSRHIDWVLWRDASDTNGLATVLRPMSCKIITDTLPNGRYPSDHFPVSVTFVAEQVPGSLHRSRL